MARDFFTLSWRYSDGYFDARIFQEFEGDWALEIFREGCLLDDLRGFPTLDAAQSLLFTRHPGMMEVEHE